MKHYDKFTPLDPVTNADAISTISCAEALRRREKPVVLFTAALLFTRCRFDRDPVVEFDAYMPAPSADLRPFCVDLKQDSEWFFHGLGTMPAPGRRNPVNWDKRLYLIDETRAADCFGFLSGIAYSDPKTGFFASTFAYDLTIPDPTSRLRETLTVKVFGVVGNTFVSYLDYNRFSPLGVPDVQFVYTRDPQLVLKSIVGDNVTTTFTGEDPLTLRDDNG
jgi:hypothetical protein